MVLRREKYFRGGAKEGGAQSLCASFSGKRYCGDRMAVGLKVFLGEGEIESDYSDGLSLSTDILFGGKRCCEERVVVGKILCVWEEELVQKVDELE